MRYLLGLHFALVAGLFLTLSNIALIESLTHIPVSLGSTIYRLNTLGVVLLAWLFLHESLSFLQLLGIGCGLLAVMILYKPDDLQHKRKVLVVYFGVVVVAAIMRASYGVVSKAGLSAGVDANTLMLVAAICWIVGGLIYAMTLEHTLRLSKKALHISLAAGVVVYAIVNTLIAGLTTGDASIVVPISNLGFLTALAISVIVRWEPMTPRKGIAMGFAVLAIVLLSRAA